MRKLLLVALLPAMLLTSCTKHQDYGERDNDRNQDIVAFLNRLKVDVNTDGVQFRDQPRQATFQLLSHAIAQAGLANELNNPDFAYTLFAPTDDAFAAIGLGTRQAINAVPTAQLKAILLYHVLGSKVLAAQVPNTSTEITMLSSQKAYVVRKNMNVFINGAPVVAADIAAKSGVIHAINRVLLPPAGNIVEVLAADPRYSFLVAAVQTAGLTGALTASGPLTVFAPTNDAFIAAGFNSIAAIQAATPAQLTPILTYHVNAGRVFSSDLSNGQVVNMLSGGTTTILLGASAQIDGANSLPSRIIQTNTMATNGVIHTIDRVLLP